MDKAAITCIDSHVIHVKTVDAEEDQVTGRQRIHRHRPGGELLFTRGSWNFDADTLVRVNSQAAAIKALLIRAAEVIRRADQLHGRAGDGNSAVTGRRLLHLTRNAATGRQQQHQNNGGDRIAQESSLTPIRAT